MTMKIFKKVKFSLLFVFVFLCTCSILHAEDNITERYERILARLDAEKGKPQSIEQSSNEPYKTYDLTFEHDKFPHLDGTWRVSRSTIKRLSNPYLTQPNTFTHCNSVLPFEIRDFKDKEVIISARGPDFFVVNSKYPVTQDIYNDPNRSEDITYYNFGFKAVLDPKDITYAYTPKVENYMGYAPRSRQLWLNGRLQFGEISQNKIVAKGYEIEHSPKCSGFLLDEVEFVFERYKGSDFGPEKRKVPFLEQPAYAEPIDIVNERKYMPPLDSAEDRSGFKPSENYKPIDTTTTHPAPKGVKTAGMW